MQDFADLVDLASERMGGAVIYANDEFFAAKENLVKVTAPVFLPDEYTERGKWMDGWESRRRREPGHDFAIVRLGVPGIVRGVVVDTSHFKGNYPEACSVEGACLDGYPSPAALLDPSVAWTTVVPQNALTGDTRNTFMVASECRFTHLRLTIFPDGGVARFRVHGDPLPRLARMAGRGEIDLAAADLGGQAVSASDMFFGHRHNLIAPGDARNMGEGWETKRRRGPGHDWVVIKLAAPGVVRRVLVDTTHFKGNAPASCELEGANDNLAALDLDARPILPRVALQPHTKHLFVDEVQNVGRVRYVRFAIHPDGGVARLRVFGELDDADLVQAGVRFLDALPDEACALELRRACGSRRFADTAQAGRPFSSIEGLHRAADRALDALDESDWLEAFGAHPRIGERSSASWSAAEQSGVESALPDVSRRIADGNRAYEAKHGFIYIVCATGRSAAEMLSELERRLEHDRATEIETAAREQRKITHLRLDKLVRT